MDNACRPWREFQSQTQPPRQPCSWEYLPPGPGRLHSQAALRQEPSRVPLLTGGLEGSCLHGDSIPSISLLVLPPNPSSQPPDLENGILSSGLSGQLCLMLRCFDSIMEYLLCFYDFYQTWASLF